VFSRLLDNEQSPKTQQSLQIFVLILLPDAVNRVPRKEVLTIDAHAERSVCCGYRKRSSIVQAPRQTNTTRVPTMSTLKRQSSTYREASLEPCTERTLINSKIQTGHANCSACPGTKTYFSASCSQKQRENHSGVDKASVSCSGKSRTLLI
jgi:hypothetical protein